ncbi:TPA: hypothetical protein V1S98_001162 [Streptococcus pneumoniae]|nr:hypothetical protein [Streptococcus pneumoniae]HEU6135157.1 hypothetical protein [Streptococcus pneumoniae]HEW1239931.1 hypothetical protein [Streptococcus pneumoniae]HEW8200669.1 hypothetical protein [Streptococcus pneumoniae]HEW8641991.1 hypothetical protein [Streptococcus pneumoniae]
MRLGGSLGQRRENEIFFGLLAILFIKPIIGIVKFFWMIISFAVQLLFYKIVFKILDWLFKLI